MLSTERRRHDVHVLFGDVIYDVRNAHWRVNKKKKKKKNKKKIYSFSVITIKFSSRVMKTFKFSLVLRTLENTDVFITLDDNIYGIHSKRVNILYIYDKNQQNLFSYQCVSVHMSHIRIRYTCVIYAYSCMHKEEIVTYAYINVLRLRTAIHICNKWTS